MHNNWSDEAWTIPATPLWYPNDNIIVVALIFRLFLYSWLIMVAVGGLIFSKSAGNFFCLFGFKTGRLCLACCWEKRTVSQCESFADHSLGYVGADEIWGVLCYFATQIQGLRSTVSEWGPIAFTQFPFLVSKKIYLMCKNSSYYSALICPHINTIYSTCFRSDSQNYWQPSWIRTFPLTKSFS